MGDEADAAVGQRIRLQVAERANPESVVHETHAARTAYRHAGFGGDGRDLVPESMGGAEEDGGSGPRRGGRRQLVEQHRIGDAEQGHVDGPVQVTDRRDTRQVADPVVFRVDESEARRTPLRLDDHPRSEAVGAGARTHQRHRPRAEHRGDVAVLTHERRNRLRPFFLSAIAARAACQPGIPQTPPPACVPELPLYSPAIGVR